MKKIVFGIYFFVMCMCLSVSVSAQNYNGYIVKVNQTKTRVLKASIAIEQIANNTYLAKNDYELNSLKSNYQIDYIEPNYEVKLLSLTSDPYYNNQWNLNIVQADCAWELGCYGNNVKIGVIDSGLSNHVDINNNKLDGYNYINNTTDVTDDIGHGTFVSGVIASEKNDIGIVGVAYRSKIVPLKCFDNNTSTYVSTIIAAINDAVNLYDCKIINMSFGLTDYSSALETAIDNGVAKGAIFVAAVGNDGNTAKYYPASYKNVIGVGSVNQDESISWFSQINDSVLIVAPGNSVLSLGINNPLVTGSGTSFAAPIVTGIVANLKNIDDNINTDIVKSLLKVTSRDLGDIGYDVTYGYGLISMEALADKMLEGQVFFASPIDKENDLSKVIVYNNTNFDREVNSIFANYIGNKLVSIWQVGTELHAKDKQTFNCNFSGQIKHILWQGLGSQIPLCQVRVSNN